MLARCAPNGAVAAADHLAASAGAEMLVQGGSAVDAAVAAAAVMAVTSPHMCGLGGDMFALVVRAGERPAALNASGRAGSGADPDALRERGMRRMPFQGDLASVTVPGFVDGLAALQQRFARLDLGRLLAPARRLAARGFPVSPTLAVKSAELEPALRQAAFGSPRPLRTGQRARVPGVERALAAIAEGGRAGFYEGEAGRELLMVGAGQFDGGDLTAGNADWVQALSVSAFERELWTVPPNSQGFLALSGAWIADAAGVPGDPQDEAWASALIEAARQAAHDRVAVLHEHADGWELVGEQRLAARAAAVRDSVSGGHRDSAGRRLADSYARGDTTYLCAVDGERTGVSLIMSNAAGFGSGLILPEHGIFLHNRGIGFSLEPGHPAEYGPRRRPPHTLSPVAVTRSGHRLDAVLGTMGGDAQPQILLQLLARTLRSGQDPGTAVHAPRWVLSREPTNGFDVWATADPPIVRLEHDAPEAWLTGLRRRGHEVRVAAPGDHEFGHAQMISVGPDDVLWGAADPRTGDGAVVGH